MIEEGKRKTIKETVGVRKRHKGGREILSEICHLREGERKIKEMQLTKEASTRDQLRPEKLVGKSSIGEALIVESCCIADERMRAEGAPRENASRRSTKVRVFFLFFPLRFSPPFSHFYFFLHLHSGAQPVCVFLARYCIADRHVLIRVETNCTSCQQTWCESGILRSNYRFGSFSAGVGATRTSITIRMRW